MDIFVISDYTPHRAPQLPLRKTCPSPRTGMVRAGRWPLARAPPLAGAAPASAPKWAPRRAPRGPFWGRIGASEGRAEAGGRAPPPPTATFKPSAAAAAAAAAATSTSTRSSVARSSSGQLRARGGVWGGGPRSLPVLYLSGRPGPRRAAQRATSYRAVLRLAKRALRVCDRGRAARVAPLKCLLSVSALHGSDCLRPSLFRAGGSTYRGSQCVPAMTTYSFPILNNNEILLCLHELEVNFSEDHLMKPNEESVRPMYSSLVQMLVGVSREELQQPVFGAIDALEFPELHDDSIGTLAFGRALCRLMEAAGVADFSLHDISKPDPQRLRRHLSALINFAKFREEKLSMYQELQENADVANEKRSELDQQNAKLKAELRRLEEAQQKEAAEVASVEAQCGTLTQQISDLNGEQNTIQEDVRQMKAKTTELSDTLANTKFALVNAHQEAERLQTQIVQSPDKLAALVRSLEENALREKKLTEDAEASSKELLNRLDVVRRVRSPHGPLLGESHPYDLHGSEAHPSWGTGGKGHSEDDHAHGGGPGRGEQTQGRGARDQGRTLLPAWARVVHFCRAGSVETCPTEKLTRTPPLLSCATLRQASIQHITRQISSAKEKLVRLEHSSALKKEQAQAHLQTARQACEDAMSRAGEQEKRQKEIEAATHILQQRKKVRAHWTLSPCARCLSSLTESTCHTVKQDMIKAHTQETEDILSQYNLLREQVQDYHKTLNMAMASWDPIKA
eukprot:scaffold659_cov329-Prasinococcus_capsulatus_cf.AAC.13